MPAASPRTHARPALRQPRASPACYGAARSHILPIGLHPTVACCPCVYGKPAAWCVYTVPPVRTTTNTTERRTELLRPTGDLNLSSLSAFLWEGRVATADRGLVALPPSPPVRCRQARQYFYNYEWTSRMERGPRTPRRRVCLLHATISTIDLQKRKRAHSFPPDWLTTGANFRRASKLPVLLQGPAFCALHSASLPTQTCKHSSRDRDSDPKRNRDLEGKKRIEFSVRVCVCVYGRIYRRGGPREAGFSFLFYPAGWTG
ncbi:hypothetical protein BC827DRAFT_533854 [Russula dissimulans]|nr:hypothetical protein BC827DRAFT_533854 [Russula dissimulans]